MGGPLRVDYQHIEEHEKRKNKTGLMSRPGCF